MKIKERIFWLNHTRKDLRNIGWGFKSLVEDIWRTVALRNPPWAS